MVTGERQIWITGASGFLGSQILNQLSLRKIEKIVAISREPKAENTKFVKWVQPLQVPEICPEDRVSIIHAATDYGWNEEPERSTIEANLALPLSLIRRAGDNLESFVALDSFYNKIDRHYPYLKQYSRSKRMLIQWLKEERPAFPVTRVFLEHLYGPGDSPKKFVPWLLRALSAGEDIPLTQGQQIRDFTFVQDAASAVLEIWESSLPKQFGFFEYEVGHGIATSIREFSIFAKETLESSSRLLFGEVNDRQGEIAASVAQSPSSQGLKWRPKVSLKEGILLTSQWLSGIAIPEDAKPLARVSKPLNKSS